ncbi:MAG: 50S ribosomal protein L11 [Candidatus Helarchaeales archaeon]
MSEKVTIEALVEGGKASGGPPIGPALGPTGVNVLQVVNKINELTKEFEGLKIPVKIIANRADKSFEVIVGKPPASALILKEAGISKGSNDQVQTVGNITLEQAISVAKAKMDQFLDKTLKAAVKTILGTCNSMGITVDGKSPKEVQKEIDDGLHDDKLIE